MSKPGLLCLDFLGVKVLHGVDHLSENPREVVLVYNAKVFSHVLQRTVKVFLADLESWSEGATPFLLVEVRVDVVHEVGTVQRDEPRPNEFNYLTAYPYIILCHVFLG